MRLTGAAAAVLAVLFVVVAGATIGSGGPDLADLAELERDFVAEDRPSTDTAAAGESAAETATQSALAALRARLASVEGETRVLRVQLAAAREQAVSEAGRAAQAAVDEEALDTLEEQVRQLKSRQDDLEQDRQRAETALEAALGEVNLLRAKLTSAEARPAALAATAASEANEATSEGAEDALASLLQENEELRAELAAHDQGPLTEVHFESSSATLTPGGLQRTIAAAEQLLEMNVREVKVEGHSDRLGEPSANRALSQRRAQAVADVLVAHGIAPELIRVTGLGESSPPISTPDGVAEPLNRCVGIMAVLHQ